MLLHAPPQDMVGMSPLPTPSLPFPSLLPSRSSSPGVDLCCFPVPCPQKTSPAPPQPCCLPAAFPHPAPPSLGQVVPAGWRGPQPRCSPPTGVSTSPAPHPTAVGCARPRTPNSITGHVPQCHHGWDTVAGGPQTQPGPHCCSGAGTSGRHPWGRVPPPRCHPCHIPDPCQALSSWGPCEQGVPLRHGAGARGPPERQIPSTSYRRSLDLVSSWCEAVITLISSGIAFPPCANFVSTVTSPRGVHALGPAAESEAEAAKPGAPKPTQKQGPPPPSLGHPQTLVPHVHREPFCPLAALPEGSGCSPRSQGGAFAPIPPGCRAGARGGSQRPAVGLGARRAWALSSLRVLAVTQYPPDVRAIWEETIKASGNGY